MGAHGRHPSSAIDHLLPRRIDYLSLVEAVSVAQSTRLMLWQWYSMSRTAKHRFLRRQAQRPTAPITRRAAGRHMPLPATTVLRSPVGSASPAGPTTAARRSRPLRGGPRGDCGDRPVGPSGCSMGQGGTDDHAIGPPLRPGTHHARDSRAAVRSPLAAVPPASFCSAVPRLL